jgi:hypothetical protein
VVFRNSSSKQLATAETLIAATTSFRVLAETLIGFAI